MKFMEKAKRFFTLNANRKDGFTLVELIVVIAILAILAGVAVPAYSGYIEKSKRAGDETLLAAVNKAFASACSKNGSDIYLVDSAAATLENGAVTSVEPFGQAFALFYAGNENSKFEVFTGIYFDPVLHMFVEGVGLTYNGVSISISKTAAENLMNSTFGEMGTEALLDQINTVTDIAAGMAGGSLSNVFGSEDFQKSAMEILGVSTEDEFNAKYQGMVGQLVATGMSEADAMAKLNANAAVLYAANNASNYTTEQINSLFSDGTATASSIMNNLAAGGDTAEGMAQTALVYGMYTAYANASGDPDKIANCNDPSAVLGALTNDPDFLTYAQSTQGQSDMNAYKDSLGIIVDSASSDSSVVEHLMINGFNNEELKNVISGAIG